MVDMCVVCIHIFSKLLDMVSGKPSPDECSDGAQPYNKAKNRYENKLPCLSIFGFYMSHGN